MTEFDPGTSLRITDLARPVLSTEQKAAVEHFATLPVEMNVDAVLEEASRQTRLSDFGAEDFKERLAVQLQSVDEDPLLNNMGRMVVFGEKVLNAANRLRLGELLKKHPEIHRIRIRRPLIIAGLPRSGTTHLVNMIAADTRFRSMPYWESRQPVPDIGEEAPRGAQDPRYRHCAEAWKTQDALLPLLKNMHAMTPDHIHEEIELADMDFASYTLEWIAYVPRWRDYYLQLDQEPHYHYMKTALQALRHYAGPDQWVLKSPQHLEHLPILLRTFPDATIGVTHRDPVAVISSTLTMIAYGCRLRHEEPPLARLAEYWVDRIERLLRACVRDIDSLPGHRVLEILFDEFMADDLGMVKRLYRRAELEMTGQAEQQLRDYLAQNPRGKHGQILYDLEGDFGISEKALRERFAFYYERYPELLPSGSA